MNEPSHLHAGRRMHRIVSTELCCHGSCAIHQGRGECSINCPRYRQPDTSPSAAATWSAASVVIVCVACLSLWAVFTFGTELVALGEAIRAALGFA